MQSEQKNPDAVEQSREQVLELGSDLTKGKTATFTPSRSLVRLRGIRPCQRPPKPPNMSMSCRFWRELRRATRLTASCSS